MNGYLLQVMIEKVLDHLEKWPVFKSSIGNTALIFNLASAQYKLDLKDDPTVYWLVEFYTRGKSLDFWVIVHFYHGKNQVGFESAVYEIEIENPDYIEKLCDFIDMVLLQGLDYVKRLRS